MLDGCQGRSRPEPPALALGVFATTIWPLTPRDRAAYHAVRMDFLTPRQRSRRMSLIRKKDTRPELIVRQLVHGLGYRFRLHRADLPGTPDIVLTRLRKVIDVRGCFWHC